MHEFVIARDFSVTPGGRYRTDGPYSGEEFREDYLLPLLEEHDSLSIVLDGTRGYPSSFLDEAFAGIVRKRKWTSEEFHGRFHFRASGSFQIYLDDINQYVSDEARRSSR